MLLVRVRGEERFGVALEILAPLDDEDAAVEVSDRLDFGAESEAVEQLRAKLALLGVARADEPEARRMFGRDAFALDAVAPRRGHVEQKINEVVFEQVHFVNV